MLKNRKDCRVCHSNNVTKFLSLGKVPLAGGFIKKNEIPQEQKFDLDVYFCRNCSLVQIMDIISSEILFKDYRYLSSMMKMLRDHFENHAIDLISRYKLDEKKIVIEIGCNDGVLLTPLTKRGIKAIGFEPAKNIAEIAKEKDLEIINSFFSKETAKSFLTKNGKVDLILANNVFAHIDNLDDIMEGIKLLLNQDGYFVFEVHYIVDLIEKNQFDTIYHEHLCYYSIKSIQHLMNRYGMEIIFVKRIPIHSGSISVHAKKIQRSNIIDTSVNELLKIEDFLHLHTEEGFKNFAYNVEIKRTQLITLLKKIKAEKKKIIAYGASGRGTILVNYCAIGKDLIDYVIDESPERYGRVMPGVHVPIYPPSRFREDIITPNYVLILAWSYVKEITQKEGWFTKMGGNFIIPLPEITIF